MNKALLHARSLRAQRGLSLVELMVGITVGLFVVAAATSLVANQLTDNRKLLVETQVQQDLRASMDIITRQLRRAGALNMAFAQGGLASPSGAGGAKNDFATVTPSAGASTVVDFEFYRNEAEQGPYGFKLEGTVIKTRVVDGGWQDLTDSNTLKITAFSVTPKNVSSIALPCPKLCPDGTTNCWPTLEVRDFVVSITGEAKNDATVQRSISSEVRLRNDRVRFNNPGIPPPVCPP